MTRQSRSETEQLGLDAIRLVGLVALVRPDLVQRIPQDVMRREAVETILDVRREHREGGDR